MSVHTPYKPPASLEFFAVEDLLYAIRKLSADAHIDYDETCEFDGEQFCGRYCESCGCINAKVQRARAALSRASGQKKGTSDGE